MHQDLEIGIDVREVLLPNLFRFLSGMCHNITAIMLGNHQYPATNFARANDGGSALGRIAELADINGDFVALLLSACCDRYRFFAGVALIDDALVYAEVIDSAVALVFGRHGLDIFRSMHVLEKPQDVVLPVVAVPIFYITMHRTSAPPTRVHDRAGPG